MTTDYQRKGCISWDQCFMGVAFVMAQRSKDPSVQVGACIVNEENRVVSTGYNGMPNGCPDDTMPWGKKDKDPFLRKTLYVCHSEFNAILNTRVSLKGCRIYVTLFPCNDCAKAIIQSGIKEVIYLTDIKAHTDATKVSKILFQKVNMKVRRYVPTNLELTIGNHRSKL